MLLRAHPAISGLLFAAMGPKLWRSSDAGLTWTQVYTARPREENQPGLIGMIGFDELAPATVYLFSTDAFSIRQDTGNQWVTKTVNSSFYFLPTGIPGGENRIESDPHGSGALIANSGSGPLLSRDGGATWTGIRPPTGQTSSVAAFSRTRSGRISAGVSAGAAGSLWVSDNWGQTWSGTRAQPSAAVVDLFTLPEMPSRLYAVTLAGFRVSEDDGETWSSTTGSSLLGYQVSRATGCSSGTVLVVTQRVNQLAVSSDQGRKWQDTPVRDVQKFTAGPGCALYALKTLSADGFVASLHSTGEIQWATYLGSVDVDAVTAVSTDRAGNVLVAGTTGTTTDILLAKFAPDGRQLWQKTIGGDSWDVPFGLAATDSGDVVLAGRTSSAAFPVTAGAARIDTGSGFVIKLNPAGEILWSTYLDTGSLALERDESVLVVGSERLFRVDRAGAAVQDLQTMVKRPAVVRTDVSGNVFIAGTVMADETRVTPGAYASPGRSIFALLSQLPGSAALTILEPAWLNSAAMDRD